jgi:hypothetical protein
MTFWPRITRINVSTGRVAATAFPGRLRAVAMDIGFSRFHRTSQQSETLLRSFKSSNGTFIKRTQPERQFRPALAHAQKHDPRRPATSTTQAPQ